DRLGNLGSPDESTRKKAVENHYPWVEAAKYLGCHSIRVNALANSEARPYEEQMNLSADGLRGLTEFADPRGINVIVENHGSWSSNGAWLAAVMKKVDHPRCGTLPDFGNFCIRRSAESGGGCEESYDKYKGVQELMPYAKAVSAKAHQFDAEGNEVEIDFERMMRIVLDAGYRSYVGVEYEGRSHTEPEGIRATIALLERVREKLESVYANS
ncbi:MAG: sugar phosphate isomerase/epimerase family protein, partial [Rhodothermales bacterium]|nr:sugar phosphate isomerase/epimerase family protein [Rhodothermales bacterium]